MKPSRPNPRRNRVLTIKTLDGLVLWYDDREIHIAGRKSRALIGYLAITEAPASRERLVGLLWSKSEEGRARGSLRQCLREVREI